MPRSRAQCRNRPLRPMPTPRSAPPAVGGLRAGGNPDDPRLINTCYSLVAPDYGITVAAVYRPMNGQLVEVMGSAGTSPPNAPQSLREQEAKLADGWFRTITSEMFG